MRMPIRSLLLAISTAFFALAALQDLRAAAPQKRIRASQADLPDSAQRTVKYFSDIHPVLIERCVSCHGPDKQKGGLRLDSREDALRGGETYGPAIVPGKSAESPLLLFMAHLERDMEMPPKKEERLPETTVSLMRAWIDQGAEWPSKGTQREAGTPALGNQELLFKKAATHWSFQTLPAAEAATLARGSETIDRLVDSKRKSKGLSPSPRAGAFTLLKRLHFDLTGLPPTPEEMDAFQSAFSNNANAAVTAKVDALLASPHFGERWGRYWLDIARYADAQDLFPGQDLRYPFAWTYRDYVIKAFNNDKPYDQFIRDQIAADLYGLQEDDATLAALGFLTVGPRFLRNQIEQISDRIDVVTRGIMGLTVACARCHNHKFDPIPTTDFYALYGVFQSSVIPDPLPLILLPDSKPDPKLSAEYAASKAKIRGSIEELNARERTRAIEETLANPERYLAALCEMEYKKRPLNAILNTSTLSAVALTCLAEQKRSLKKAASVQNDPILGPLAAVVGTEAGEGREIIKGLLNSGRVPGKELVIHPRVIEVLREKKPESEEALFQAYGSLLAKLKISGPESDFEQIRKAFTQNNGLLDFQPADVEKTAPNTTSARAEYRKLYSELAELENTHPGAPIRAMAVKDTAKPTQPVVFVRGDPAKRGEAVERRFLEILDPKKTPFSSTQSGRKELAEAITHPDNPLTPRVWANQVWRHLLGHSLVKTTSDFGLQSEPPTNPQLLDWLASALVQRNWSTKQLIRDIVLSNTYQQDSANRALGAECDPDNTWLWRANRRRLDVEAMRDGMLAISGRLDRAAGGRAVSLTSEPFSGRRTVYGFVDRVHINPLFVAFDFPSPDTANTERTQTMVPQQALFALNDAFIIEQARALAARVQTPPHTSDAGSGNASIRALYRHAFQRAPSTEEEDLAKQILSDAATGAGGAVHGSWEYGFGSADPVVPRPDAFQPLSHFDPRAKRYQGSAAFPDRAQGFVSLNEGGGHPGDGLHRAAIRRWTAPHDGEFELSGELTVSPAGTGDGVRARIISSRGGLLGEWVVDRINTISATTLVPSTRLTAGEVIDFTVDSRETNSGDGFRWSPSVRDLRAPEMAPKKHRGVWDAKSEFKAPPAAKLTPLQRMAQALLMSNEFLFVD